MRVGKITKIWLHEADEHLYCENIDIGGGEIRNVVSGLGGLVPMESLD
jgi:tRNA-binding EMAP/Myf-like protein